MTTNELIAYYANLLILQYLGKPKAYATVQAFVSPAIMDQLPLLVRDAFILDTAIGVQLDTIGKYAGVVRTGYGIGGAYISLSDSDFRVFIKMAIIRNTAGSSLNDIQNLLHQFFNNQIVIYDYLGMRIGYAIDSAVGSTNLAQLFISEGLLPKPMGVTLSATIYTTPITNIFGMRNYDIPTNPTLPQPNASPFNNYDTPSSNYPWLSYSNTITI